MLIPSSLLSYTQASKVEASSATLTELLADLDRQFPGLRFRVADEQDQMRAHMRFFVNNEQCSTCHTHCALTDEVFLLQALSGG